jgi:hypothetical protein
MGIVGADLGRTRHAILSALARLVAQQASPRDWKMTRLKACENILNFFLKKP